MMSLLLKLAGKGRRAFEILEHGLVRAEISSKTVYTSFAEAKKSCETTTPYQDSDLIEVVFAKTLRYINSLPTETFISQNEMNLTFFLTQLFNKKTISVIDIGGACGAQYFFLRKLLPDSVRLSWRIVETPAMVARASRLAADELSFHTDLKSAAREGSADAVLASGVLQYMPEPYEYLKSIVEVRPDYISIHRTPFFEERQEAVHIQKSRLADNGIGPLPEGFADREVEYPITTMCLRTFRSILAQAYEPFAEWDRHRVPPIPGSDTLVFSSCWRLKRT